MAQRPAADKLKTNYTNSYADRGVAFVTFDPTKSTSAEAVALASRALHGYQAVSSRTEFENVHTRTSVRNEFTRGDYESFRPSEAIPSRPKDVIASCMKAYKKVGVVRNIIDLMADFTAEGVRLNHPNPRIQKFARRWFEHKVDGTNVTERFSNYFYRLGVVVAKRRMAKLRISEERRLAIADGEMLEPTEESEQPLKTQRKNIPCGYNFLNPLSLEMVGGEISQFVGKQIIALKITPSLRMKLTSPTSSAERQLVSMIPTEIMQAIRQGATTLPLDQDKLAVHFYKKDDWDLWPSPMLEAILDDLVLLEKMKLADLSALDGVISQIRIWKIGNLDKGILPTEDAIQKLADILLSNPGGGAFDLIWGPELEFEDASTKAHEFLGGDKYIPVLDSIHAGLGVPPTLTGSANQPGLTNNFISLQTLIKRLGYGRRAVTKFWERECELLRQAMNWQRAPTVEFDRMILTDEAAEKALLIQLVDRGIVSEELVVQRFGEVPELEDLRKKREQKERENKQRPEQIGPYFVPDKMHDLTKTALTAGHINPSDVGVERKTQDPTPFDREMDMQKQGLKDKKEMDKKKISAMKMRGRAGQGRPKGKKDSSRKTRKPRIRTSAEIAGNMTDFLNTIIWAKNAQAKISELTTPGFLHYYKKKNMRSLSTAETVEAERVKLRIFANLPQYSEVDNGIIQQVLASKNTIPNGFDGLYNKLAGHFLTKTGKEPNLDESRHIQAVVYSLLSAATD